MKLHMKKCDRIRCNRLLFRSSFQGFYNEDESMRKCVRVFFVVEKGSEPHLRGVGSINVYQLVKEGKKRKKKGNAGCVCCDTRVWL